jgi:hypothetical protein
VSPGEALVVFKGLAELLFSVARFFGQHQVNPCVVVFDIFGNDDLTDGLPAAAAIETAMKISAMVVVTAFISPTVCSV